MKYAVRTEDLTKKYKGSLFNKSEVVALDHLNIEVPTGSVFGFLGPNGAGKTTTIRCLMDLIRPSAGKAWVLDTPVGNLNIKEEIGFLPDSPSFGGHLTANEFLVLSAKLLKLPRHEIKARVEEVLEIVEMKDYKKSKLGGFSRGMTQRIGIAQAILNRPRLLVLDEPLVGLDPHGRKDLISIVNKQKERGSSIFFCSHILSDVEKICDYVGILKKGKLLAYGKTDELTADSGMIVTVDQSDPETAQKLMMEATESKKDAAGNRVITLDHDAWEKLNNELNLDGKDTVSIEHGHNSLENFFFKTVQKEV
ncbi:MAG: ABC transporter ATP-binding protein [Lentisphaeraceae bacterium]|nr:ABC transporter ATP-binding protein [Lentisphaeraceae bacterium]